MGYGLGIDLGNTRTAAAVHVNGRADVVKLGTSRDGIPSVVLVLADGGVLVGEAAERRAEQQPERLAREFKRRLGDPVPLLVGGSPYPAHLLTARLLRWVLEVATGQYDAAPGLVTVTCPASWGPYKRDLLEQAAREAGAGRVRLRTEPEAAAIDFAASGHSRPGESIMVYDLGGSTFGAAVLRRTTDGFDLLGRPDGLDHLGGVDFDEAVFGHVIGALGDTAAHLDPDDVAVTAALVRLRRDCAEAKEALSSDTAVMIPVALPGLHTRVRLNRSEFEAMIEPPLAQTIAASRRALHSAGMSADDLAAVVLAGGSSRIPLVRQLLAAEFGRPVEQSARPDHAVARGAALPAVALPAAAPPAATPRESPAAVPLPAVVAASLPVPPPPTGPAVAPPAVPTTDGPLPLDPVPAAPPNARPAPVRDPKARPRPLTVRYRWLLAGALSVVLAGSAALVAWPAPGRPGAGDPAASSPAATTKELPRLQWSATAGGPITGSPAVDAITVYAGSLDGTVYAWERARGTEKWRYPTGNPVSAPQVDNGQVYLTSGVGTLVVLGAADGAVRWQAPARTGTPSAFTVAGDSVYLNGAAGTLYAYSRKGESRWRFRTSAEFTSTPVAAAGLVYAASDDGRVHALDAKSGRRQWRATVGATPTALAVADSQLLVVTADGRMTALDARSGRERWEFTAGDLLTGAPSTTDGLVHLGTAGGNVYALGSADRQVRWWFTVRGGGPVAASPVLSDGVLYVGSRSNWIYALDPVTGRRLWEFATAGPVSGSPVAGSGMLYAGADDGRLYALALPRGGGVGATLIRTAP